MPDVSKTHQTWYCDIPAHHSLIIDRVTERASAFVLRAPTGDANCVDPLFTNR